MQSPDAVYFRWRQLREELEAPPPPTIARLECRAAVRPSPHCPACGRAAVLYRQDRRVGTDTDWDTPTGVESDPALAAPFEARCSACLRPWPLVIVPVLERRPCASLERRLAELVTLRAVLFRRASAAERRIYLGLYLDEQVGGFAVVAETANKRWPRWAPPYRHGRAAERWSVTSVRTVVLAGRQRILDEMIRRRLWRFA